MRDPYEVLGISRSASAEDIKKTYRKLARSLHPDVNPGDAKAEERFKEVTAAYDLLSDETKRARFDRGEINPDGTERMRNPWGNARGGHGGGHGGAQRGGFGFDSMFSEDDLFSEMFRSASRGSGGRQHSAPRKGADVHYSLTVTFEEAALGAARAITLTNGKKINVKVPPACEDGKSLRLKGMGSPGQLGGADGDALVEITVAPHPLFRREKQDVIAELPVTLKEAVLGAKVVVPTVDGRVTVTIPEGSNSGTTLRLRGKGIPAAANSESQRGDQLVRLRITLSDPQDAALKAFLTDWDDTAPNPRVKLGLED
ncbi:DnaJ C-terminal domain-containing protein [Novispirillum itersonii]|uniref:DnaJ C-terminal domain-containing protein n=1 Tax=Novispirillum itersonii TaxID=189 RepID=UPI00036137F3|nr:J domain-containing protein [Novispirillum itersonii]